MVLLSGCGDDGSDDGSKPNPDARPSGCAPGERPLEDASCLSAGVPPEACAEGFAANADGCDPILPDGCAPGSMALPGETSCRAIAECGDGAYGAAPIDSTTQHVDQAYAGMDSDGSARRPWRTIQAGVTAAPAGAVVAVAAGTYAEDVLIAQTPVRIWGRCPSMVHIQGLGANYGTITIEHAGGTEVRGIAVSGPTEGIDVVGEGTITLDQLWVHDTGLSGVLNDGVLGAGRVVLQRSLVERATRFATYAYGSTLEIVDSELRDTQPDPVERTFGRAVEVDEIDTGQRAQGIVRGTVMSNNHDISVYVSGADIFVERSVVRDTRPRQVEQGRGRAMAVLTNPETGSPSTATISKSVFERHRDIGILVIGSDLSMHDSVVRDVRSRIDNGLFGSGVHAQHDEIIGRPSKVVVHSSLIERTQALGILVEAGTLDVESTVVRDVTSDGNALGGRGINLQSSLGAGPPAGATIRSSVVERAREGGIMVVGGTAEITSTLVRGVEPEEARGLLGDGVVVSAGFKGASATVAGCRIEGAARAGVAVFGSAVSLADVSLECNAIDLDGERGIETEFTLEDLGGNVCGCGEERRECRVVTSNLEPPEPLETQ